MQTPLTIAFEGVPESDAVQLAVRRHAADLERFYDRITSCRVVIARPNQPGHRGALYHVRIDLAVPGGELVINRERRFDRSHEDVYVAMHDAFDAARRRLEDYVRREHTPAKSHTEPAGGRVAKLFPMEGYGFILTSDAREIYFHRNSLVKGYFDRLNVGDQVWFAEELGDKGPQASSVRVAHPHRAARAGTETPV